MLSRGSLQLVFFLLVVLLGPLVLRNSREVERDGSKRAQVADLVMERERVARERARVLFVGNSMLFSRIDRSVFREASGLKNRFLTNAGSASACWYLYLKNILKPSGHRPEVVVIFFRDQVLTWPEFRTGSYFAPYFESLFVDDESVVARVLDRARLARGGVVGVMADGVSEFYGINAQPERFQSTVNDLALDLTALGQGKRMRRFEMNERFSIENLRHDLAADDAASVTARGAEVAPQRFDAAPDASFLPHMIDLAEEMGVELVFYRVKKRDDVEGRRLPTPHLKPYLEDLQEYVESRGASFLDETADDIPAEWYADGDHIGKEWRDVYTRRFWEKTRGMFPTVVP